MKVTDYRNENLNLRNKNTNIICRCNRLTDTAHATPLPSPHAKRPKFTNKSGNRFGKLNLKFRNNEN